LPVIVEPPFRDIDDDDDDDDDDEEGEDDEEEEPSSPLYSVHPMAVV